VSGLGTTTLPTCPECGWDTTQPGGTMTPSMRRWRRRLIFLVSIAPVVMMLGWAIAVSKSNGYSLSSPFPKLLDPPLSLRDIRALAEGGTPLATGELTRRLAVMAAPINAQIPGRRSIEVGLASPTTHRSRTWSIGWPFSWVTVQRDSNFADAMRRTGFIPAKTNPGVQPLGMYEAPSDPLNVPPGPRWRWQGMGLRFQKQPEETGGVFTVVYFKLPAMLLSLLLVLVSWWLLGALVLRCRRAAAVARWGPFALLMIALAALTILTAGSREGPLYAFPKMQQANFPPAPVYFTRQGFARLTADADETLRTRDDRALAADILAAAPPPTGDPDRLYLAATYDAEAALAPSSRLLTLTYKFPVLSLGRESYIRRPDFGAVEPIAPRAGLKARIEYGSVRLLWSRAIPGASTYWISINLEMLALLSTAPLVLGFLIHLACRALLVRRVKRGLCPSCKYQVAMTTP
jgi:hypothetical protein